MTTLAERETSGHIGQCHLDDTGPMPCWAGPGAAFMHVSSWPCKETPIEPLGLCVEHRIEILGRAD